MTIARVIGSRSERRGDITHAEYQAGGGPVKHPSHWSQTPETAPSGALAAKIRQPLHQIPGRTTVPGTFFSPIFALEPGKSPGLSRKNLCHLAAKPRQEILAREIICRGKPDRGGLRRCTTTVRVAGSTTQTALHPAPSQS